MRQSVPIFGLAAILLIAGNAAAQSRENDWARCSGDTDDDNVLIRACTAVIGEQHRTNDEYALAFKNLCLAYNDKGDRARAIRACDQAIHLRPDYIDAYLFRGHAYLNKGEYELAIQDYDKAISLGSHVATTFVQRGAANHKAGNELGAIEDLNRAIDLDPNDATAFYIRGTAYEAENDNDRALADYSQAIRLAPSFAVAFYRRGVLERQMGNTRAGAEDIARARKIDRTLGK